MEVRSVGGQTAGSFGLFQSAGREALNREALEPVRLLRRPIIGFAIAGPDRNGLDSPGLVVAAG
jgi:hypothetical protein